MLRDLVARDVQWDISVAGTDARPVNVYILPVGVASLLYYCFPGNISSTSDLTCLTHKILSNNIFGSDVPAIIQILGCVLFNDDDDDDELEKKAENKTIIVNFHQTVWPNQYFPARGEHVPKGPKPHQSPTNFYRVHLYTQTSLPFCFLATISLDIEN